jgi:hypothetical protein
MANLAKDARAGLDTSQALYAPTIVGALAGEDLNAVSPCYIKSDGLVYMSDGTAANEAAKVDGFTGKSYKAGQAVTLFGVGFRARYSAGTLTPGANLFLGDDPGVLAGAATTGGTGIIARAINATDIRAVVIFA